MLLLYCTATLLSRLLNEANGSAGPSSEALSVNQSINYILVLRTKQGSQHQHQQLWPIHAEGRRGQPTIIGLNAHLCFAVRKCYASTNVHAKARQCDAGLSACWALDTGVTTCQCHM